MYTTRFSFYFNIYFSAIHHSYTDLRRYISYSGQTREFFLYNSVFHFHLSELCRQLKCKVIAFRLLPDAV